MAIQRIARKPGQDIELSFSAARDTWVAASLGRWREGMPEVMGGWLRTVQQPVIGRARGIHFWADLTGFRRIAVGTNSHLYQGPPGSNSLTDITPNGFMPGLVSSSAGNPYSLAIWSLSNFGQILVGCQSGGPIYSWTPGQAGAATVLQGAPAKNQGLVTLSAIQMIMAWGCTPVGGGNPDPNLVRWCDQSDPNDWIASTQNQAGSYRIPTGSRVQALLTIPNTVLLWTDVDLYSITYIGFPLVFDFAQIGSLCGLIAQKACVVLGGIPFWMSDHGFFTLGPSGPTQLPCPVWDAVFKDLDTNNQDKCFAATNFHYNEVYFFYPSLSGATGEIDSFVKLNLQTGEWDLSGNGGPGVPSVMARTCWTDFNQPGDPFSVDLNGLIQQAEQGFTQDGVGTVPANFVTGFQDLMDGGLIMAVDRFIPDFIWKGPNPSLNLTIQFRDYPGDATNTLGPFKITPTTEYVTLRQPQQRSLTIAGETINYTTWAAPRAREVAFQVSNSSGFWRWGAPRVHAYPAGTV